MGTAAPTTQCFMTMHEHLLTGCTPVPLAHYLKALGILRLVAEQKDPHACGRWRGEYFELRTSLSREELQRFFLENYRPTPVLAPWNGGSGFFPKDNQTAISAIGQSASVRFTSYAKAIRSAKQVLKDLGVGDKAGDDKGNILESCRSVWVDEALAWMDAAVALTQEGAKYPPLLGTGGNDGRLDFTNNFMQRILNVVGTDTGEPTPDSARWLEGALYAYPMQGIGIKAPIGQFAPGIAGGTNTSSGFFGSPLVNPWDFILMIEGALLFTAAATKRMESSSAGALIYPFCVRQVGAGYASAAMSDEADSRSEIWIPLWNNFTRSEEVSAIFGEGRTLVHGRAARNGIDFAQAIASLGVERGISEFQRYGFQVRNGLAYFAIPLDRIAVRRNEQAGLMADLEHAHDRLRQKCRPGAKPEAPGSIARACRQLDEAVFALAKEGDTDSVIGCLRAAGQVERAYATSLKWATEVFLAPIHGLRPDWLKAIRDVTPEFRLAASLAGSRMYLGKNETLHFRQHLEQVAVMSGKGRSWVKWLDPPKNDAVWHDGGLVDALNGILARRLMRAQQAGVKGWPDWSPRYAALDDITAFIEGRIDERLFADLLWGLVLIDWEQVAQQQREAWEGRPGQGANELGEGDTTVLPDERDEKAFHAVPSSLYSLLRLCFQRTPKGEDPVPLVPGILHRAMAGDGDGAARLAVRRLRASGLAPLISELPVAGDVARRTAASMLFPIAPREMRRLTQYITEQQPQTENA